MRKRVLSLALCFALALSLLPTWALAAEDTTISYAVEGGNLYFDPSTGAITDCEESVTSADIPSSINGVAVTSIGNFAFQNCSSLASVTIPDSVTIIGNCAFSECGSLTSVTIPDGVTSIGDWAFSGCSSLTSVTIPDGVTSIGNWAFSGCSSLTGIIIPYSVTSIGDSAFNYCISLTSVTILDGVTSIGSEAFYNCSSLTNVSIPDSVTSIGNALFNYCTSLTSVRISNSVTSIGDDMFQYCSSLTSVRIPDSVTSIGHHAFQYCSSLTSVVIPDGVTSIGSSAFSGCSSLTSVAIPDSVTSISYEAFNNCSSLTNVSIPGSVTSIGKYAFRGCIDLTSVTIPDGVTSIGEHAFAYCSSLTSVAIPDEVASISDMTFYNCSSLTSVTIPDSVTGIGWYAFGHCFSLTDVYYGGTEGAWDKISIDSGNTALTYATIHYNAGPNSSLNVSSSQIYLVDCAPKNLCVSIEQAAILSFQFNRNVTAGAGGIKLWNGDTGALVVSVPADDMRVSIQLNKVQVKLDPDIFEGDTTYFVTIDNGSFVSGSLRFHGVTGEKTWTFATDPSPVSAAESFPLKYAKKPGIFGTNDMSKPPVPDGNEDDYAAALAEWAEELGVADITQEAAKKQLGKKVYLPVTQQNAANNADPILLWDKGTTVQQVMSDLIFVENLQPYIAEMDRDLQEIERITNDWVFIPGLTLRAEAKVCEKAISWYGQINSYLNGRNPNSNFMLSVAAPFATELLANLSKSTEGDYYSFIKPFVKAELNHQANKASLSALENAGTYDEYTQAADDFELVLDATDLYKATVEDGYPGVGGVISFGADLLANTFENSDNDTLKEISKSYKTLKTTKTALKLSMAMGSSIGMFPLVVDLHNDLWRGVEAQAKALYFIGDYYISEQYPALYESVYSDGSFFPTKQQSLGSYGEYQYIVEAYQQNPDDAVLFNWTQAFRGNLETSQRDKLLHLRKELTNYAILLNYIKSIDVEQAKANLVKYVSAEMHQEKTTTNYVSCPVQINIYDKNHTELLASLSTEDTDIQNVDYGSLYLLGEDNQTKCFVYRSGEYSVEIVPYEEGTMDMMTIERDENGAVSGRYYQTVDLKQGEVFTSGEEGLYKLVDGEETVIPETERVPVAWVNLSCPDRLAMGETAQLEAQVLPVIAAEQAISWSSSDPAVLSVDESGKITAQKTGTATITASAADNVTAEQTVEVYVPVTALSVSKESVTMLTGETITPELIGSEGADLSRVRWSSGNPAVVGVAQDGTIEGLSPGKALITGAVDDVEISYSVQVYEDPLDVTIYQSDGDGDRIKLELNNFSFGTPFSGVVYTAVYEPNGRLHCIFTDELTLEAGESKLCFYPVEDLQTEQQFTVKTIVADKTIKPLQPFKSEILLGGEIEL